MKIDAKRIAAIGVLISLAMGLSLAERLLPIGLAVPVPGIKLGLANIVTLFALFYMGAPSALLILTLRCVLAAAFTGFSSLIFSLTGAIFAFFAMFVLMRGCGRFFSLSGVSMGGAVFHNIGQILAASVVTGSAVLFSYLPLLLVAGLITGFLTSLVAAPVFRAVDHNAALMRSLPKAAKNRP
jgi:heptaprenyl diphosphate synthase